LVDDGPIGTTVHSDAYTATATGASPVDAGAPAQPGERGGSMAAGAAAGLATPLRTWISAATIRTQTNSPRLLIQNIGVAIAIPDTTATQPSQFGSAESRRSP